MRLRAPGSIPKSGIWAIQSKRVRGLSEGAEFISDVIPSAMGTLAKWRIDLVVEVQDSRLFSHFARVFSRPSADIYLDEKIPLLCINPALLDLDPIFPV